jgi:hypothetical protein
MIQLCGGTTRCGLMHGTTKAVLHSQSYSSFEQNRHSFGHIVLSGEPIFQTTFDIFWLKSLADPITRPKLDRTRRGPGASYGTNTRTT